MHAAEAGHGKEVYTLEAAGQWRCACRVPAGEPAAECMQRASHFSPRV